jgi:hypothetical protein
MAVYDMYIYNYPIYSNNSDAGRAPQLAGCAPEAPALLHRPLLRARLSAQRRSWGSQRCVHAGGEVTQQHDGELAQGGWPSGPDMGIGGWVTRRWVTIIL